MLFTNKRKRCSDTLESGQHRVMSHEKVLTKVSSPDTSYDISFDSVATSFLRTSVHNPLGAVCHIFVIKRDIKKT